jgi:hypothetical protein
VSPIEGASHHLRTSELTPIGCLCGFGFINLIGVLAIVVVVVVHSIGPT